ncbi:MAG TPA: aminotransferase class V-fold PLP-dependent enzyme [Candidatus Marinimicrobia bacterium]|nr:aminotransferase class V-fold PLP-dependent enzyme [Candidatus Neomarinimicrobiota bacterium]
MKPIVSEQDFPTADQFVYLNAANVALMYSGAEQVIKEWVADVAQNGSNNFDEDAEDNVFKDLHRRTAHLINATADDIAAGSSATELLCSLAWAVSPGKDQNVVSTEIVFPSTVYPWHRVANSTGCEIRLAKEKNNFMHPDDIIDLIDQHTAVVCISHVEYGNGQTFDLQLLAEAAQEHDALLVVDATQSAGAIPIDVQACPVDALISGAYKWLCGPFGAAFMYVAPHLSEKLEPGLVGFRSHKNMWDLDASRIDYPQAAKKFEFSTMAFGCAVGLTRAIDFLNEVGVENIFQYNRQLADILITGLRSRDAVITSPLDDEDRSSIVTAYFENIDSKEIIKCLKAAQVFVSSRAGAIRFSPHLYNTAEDMDSALAEIDNCIASL